MLTRVADARAPVSGQTSLTPIAGPARRSAPSVAIVRDWLTVYAGADRVMDAVLQLFPQALVYALVYQEEHFAGRRLASHAVRTSFIQRIPGWRRWYRAMLPLMPLAVEQFDVRGHDVVISLSHAVAKGVITRPDQLHVSYVFTPLRYAWDLYFDYLAESGLDAGPRSVVARSVLHYMRLWDQASAARADVLVAASRHVARRINKLYRRDAEVVYPPVDTDRFRPRLDRDRFYLVVSRLVPYKHVDLIVAAFSRLGLPLVVIGDGPEYPRIQRLAGPTVKMLGEQHDEAVTDYLERCKAFVFAAEEDFGIAPVEAQAAGAPVIAFGRGGVAETVVAGETGLFFHDQTVDAVAEAVATFEAGAVRFHPELVRRSADRFSRRRFQAEFDALVAREWARFKAQDHAAQNDFDSRSAV